MRVRGNAKGNGEVKGMGNTRREVGKEWRRYLGGCSLFLALVMYSRTLKACSKSSRTSDGSV